jgi:hypothetical protein
MYLREANRIFRAAIVNTFFQPELEGLGYTRTGFRHPHYGVEGLSKDGIVYIYFDLDTGCEYVDGDEWVIVEYLVPFEVDIPDELKSPDYFTTITLDGRRFWRHREMVRYRQGRVKRLEDALTYIDRKATFLYEALKEGGVVDKIKKGAPPP